MSMKGIKIVAKVFQDLQTIRQQLLNMGAKKRKINQQGIQLAQLIEEMKEATKDKFAKITAEGPEE